MSGPVRALAAFLVAASASGCTTWRVRPSIDDPDKFRELSSVLRGKDAIVTLEALPPTTDRVALRVEDIDPFAIRGQTANGPRSFPLSAVRSISYRERRGPAVLGSAVGFLAGGVIGYKATGAAGSGCGRGDSAVICLLGALGGAAAGALVGGILGAVIGNDAQILVESPP